MYMNRIFGLFGLISILSGCASTSNNDNWFSGYGELQTGTPVEMQYGTFSPTDDGTTHNVAVLLPMSGPNAAVGNTIRASIETAILQRAPSNMSFTFYDTAKNATAVMTDAISTSPDVIIGPVFAGNARILREIKPESTPALSFTSDATAVGRGVMTMALMPTNSIEAIIKEMQTDNVKKFIVLAPNTESGRLMAGTAKSASEMYNIALSGLFYYTPDDSESIKNTTIRATMNTARTAANTRAREVLADILTKENLTAIEKSNLNIQLERISRTDTLGAIPYDAILFLGDADDTTKLASFMRYYGVAAGDAKMYGTALWDGTNIANDITMSGAKYAALPPVNENFTQIYEQVSGVPASRLATFGYDAANMAMGMINSNKSDAAYLLDPSGYMGMDGLFRLKPTGDNERALRIVRLNGAGTLTQIKPAPATFMTPLYNIEQRHISPASEIALRSPGINPNSYLNIPERFRSKYRSKTYGANMTNTPVTQQAAEIITIMPEDDRDIITTSDYTPVELESVSRTLIEEYEMYED